MNTRIFSPECWWDKTVLVLQREATELSDLALISRWGGGTNCCRLPPRIEFWNYKKVIKTIIVVNIIVLNITILWLCWQFKIVVCNTVLNYLLTKSAISEITDFHPACPLALKSSLPSERRVVERLSPSLKAVVDWGVVNLVKFNTSKTQVCFFSAKRRHSNWLLRSNKK